MGCCDNWNHTVSAGHCNPTKEEIEGAIDNGVTMFTHLGNGCPMTLERHDNIIQRILNVSDRMWITFIADGVHIPFYTLNNYLKIIPPEKGQQKSCDCLFCPLNQRKTIKLFVSCKSLMILSSFPITIKSHTTYGLRGRKEERRGSKTE